jgi:TatD DNase family protein
MQLFDSHCHLNDARFAPDRPAVLERARDAGLVGMLVVGYDLDTSRLACEIAAGEPDCQAAVGLHPHDASALNEETFAALSELARQPKVVAFGETGLDYYRNLSPPEVQRAAFARLIALAGELALPLVVHCREAAEDTLALLDDHRQPGQTVIMHCFSGSQQFAEACVQRDFYLGLAGPLTFPNSRRLKALAARVPLGQLLIETDCPWLAPQAHRGQRNEPAYVAEVASALAEAQGLEPAEVAAATTANACRALNLPIPAAQ